MKIAENTDRLLQLGINPDVLSRYNEPHRFYHTIAHLNDVWTYLAERGYGDNDTLLLSTIFHDIIYDPRSSTNEEDSAGYFSEVFSGDENVKKEVIQIILDTKTHTAESELSKVFCEADLNILSQPFDKLIKYEHQIFKEFQFVDYAIYKEKRIEVLKSLNQQVSNLAIDSLITYVETRLPNIAIYPGSFNPFHKGHYNILLKAEKIFDKVIIARGLNPSKEQPEFDLPDALKYRQTAEYEGLLTDYISTLPYPVTIIRGLRNGSDLQYELNQYRYLQELSNKNINIVAIFCDMKYEHISSTGIRQLKKYGKADDYLV